MGEEEEDPTIKGEEEEDPTTKGEEDLITKEEGEEDVDEEGVVIEEDGQPGMEVPHADPPVLHHSSTYATVSAPVETAVTATALSPTPSKPSAPSKIRILFHRPATTTTIITTKEIKTTEITIRPPT